MFNKIFNPVGSLFIDGSFYVEEGDDAPDYNEEKLIELLEKTRRLPEMLILLMVSNTNMRKRLYHKDKITAEFNEEMVVYGEKRKVYVDYRTKEWEGKREEAKKAALDDGGDWDDADFDALELSDSGDEAGEPDEKNLKPAKPEPLGGGEEEEGRLNKILEKLNAQWEGDKDKVAEGWYNSFKERRIPIRVVKAEGTVENVFNQINYHLNPILR